MMKKVICTFLCLNILSFNFACAELFKDNLVEQLDENLKVQKQKYQPIEDAFVFETLNNNLSIKKSKTTYFADNFANETLDSNLKVQIHKQQPIIDDLALKIDKTKIQSENKKVSSLNFNGIKIKVSPKTYYTTRKNLAEGKYIDFVLVEDINIEKAFYKKGTIIKARVETLSPNGAYGVPADLIVGNFTLPNKTILNGQISRRGANRSIWVYPTGYLLTPFFFIGLPIFAIRGGHAKLKPYKVFEVEI